MLYCTTNGKDLPTINQVKEKFGILRIYASANDKETLKVTNTIIRHYEDASEKICDTCGREGQLMVDSSNNRGGLWATRCTQHAFTKYQTVNEYKIASMKHNYSKGVCSVCNNNGAYVWTEDKTNGRLTYVTLCYKCKTKSNKNIVHIDEEWEKYCEENYLS